MEHKIMEKEPKINKQEPKAEEEIKIIDGKKYRRVFSGYTVRQYYSHETEEMGPGPGWDRFVASDKEEIAKRYGCKLKDERDFWKMTPSDLPDTPYYYWELISEDEK